jgi:transcription elongation factor
MTNFSTGKVHASPAFLRTYTPPHYRLTSMSNTSAPVPWTRENKDHLIGKEVLIVNGPKKGRVGEVRELGADMATVFFAGSQGNRTRTKYKDAILM